MAQQAFLTAIRDEPDDDTHRMVYADWLEEQGQQERAEFIRVQCHLEKLAKGAPGRRKLLARERALLKKNREAWLGPLKKVVWNLEFGWGFRRGFLDLCDTNASRFANHANLVVEHAPFLRRLTLNVSDPRELAGALRTPACERVQELHVASSRGLNLADFQAIAALSSLTSLSFYHADTGPQEMAVLAQSPHLAHLRVLMVPAEELGDGGAIELANSPYLTQLQELIINSNDIGEAGAQALAASSNFCHLRTLDLSGNPIGDAGARALVESPHLGSLEVLRLGWVGVTTECVDTLIQAPPWQHLREFKLTGNSLIREQREALKLRSGRQPRPAQPPELLVPIPASSAVAPVIETQNEEETLVRAIAENPTEDEPRLRYANWLENQSDPRGEFIRVQCELARLPEDHDHRPGLLRRERELLHAHQQEWEKPIRQCGATPGPFSRGLVEAITIKTQRFLDKAGDLFRLAPIRHVHLETVRRLVAELAACPYLAHVRSLALAAKAVNPPLVSYLLSSPHFQQLHALDLSNNVVGPEGIRAILTAPYRSHLTSLKLAGSKTYTAAIRELVASTELKALTDLDLLANEVPNNTLELLADSPLGSQLQKLRLGCGRFGVAGWQALGRLSSLRHLSLQSVALVPQWMETLMDSPMGSRLETLDLTACSRISRRGEWFDILATDSYLPALRSLILGHYAIDDNNLQSFVHSTLLAQLHTLDVSACDIRPTGVQALAQSPHAVNLLTLNLDANRLRVEGTQALADSTQLSSLRTLHLDQNGMGDGVRSLAASPHLHRLVVLTLRANQISNAGARALAESPHLEQLALLDLRSNPKIGIKARTTLLRRFGEHVCVF